MKSKNRFVLLHFPVFWIILLVYLSEYGVSTISSADYGVRQMSMWLLAVLGVMLFQISGSYNLAAGSQMTFSAAFLGALLDHDWPLWAACGMILLIAVVLGVLYTVLYHCLQTPVFVSSMGLHLLLDGISNYLYAVGRKKTYSFVGMDNTRVLGIPVWLWLAIVMTISVIFFLNRTTPGRSLCVLSPQNSTKSYSVQSSTAKHRMPVMLLLGTANVFGCLLIGTAGLLLAVRGGTTSQYSGWSYMCRILTASAIGNWLNLTRKTLPLCAIVGCAGLVMLLTLEIRLSVPMLYAENCLSALIILSSTVMSAYTPLKSKECHT